MLINITIYKLLVKYYLFSLYGTAFTYKIVIYYDIWSLLIYPHLTMLIQQKEQWPYFYWE